MTRTKRVTAPPPEVEVLDSRDSFYTDSFFDTRVDPTNLIEFLREEKSTGTLTFNLTQGAVQSICIKQTIKLEETQAETIREFLGIDDEEENSEKIVDAMHE